MKFDWADFLKSKLETIMTWDTESRHSEDSSLSDFSIPVISSFEFDQGQG